MSSLTRSEKLNIALKSDDSLVSFKSVTQQAGEVPPKVAIICRVSSHKQAHEKTIEVQEKQCLDIYQRHFKDTPDALVHTSINESLNLEKKELQFDFFSVLDRIQLGEINTVICVSYDRIFRGANRVLNAEISQIFTNNRVKLITSDGVKQYEPTNIYGSLIDSVQEGLGVVEKKSLVRKLQKARRHHLVERKQWKYCVVPFGLQVKTVSSGGRKDFVYSIVEDEAELVRDIYRLYANLPTKVIPSLGKTSPGVKLIANHLNRLGISKDNWLERIPEGHQAKKNSKNWNGVFLQRILTNPVYRGDLVVVFNETKKDSSYHGEGIAQKISVPAIVPIELWKAVEEMRAKKSAGVQENFAKSAQHLNILHRVLLCPTCNRPMTGYTSSKKARYYMCRTKRAGEAKHRQFNAIDLETNLGKLILERFHQNVIWEKLHGITGIAGDDVVDYSAELKLLEKRQSEINKEYSRLTEFLLKGVLDENQYQQQGQRIKDEISIIEARIEEINKLSTNHSSKTSHLKSTVNELQQKFNELVESQSPDLFLIIKEAVNQLIEHIEIVTIELPDLATASIEEIKELYDTGRIVPKHLTDLGWSDRKISKHLGRSGRRLPLDFNLKVTWKSGRTEVISPVKD